MYNDYQLLKFKYKMIVSIFEIYKLYLNKEQYVQIKKSINKIDFSKSITEIKKDVELANKNVSNLIIKFM